MLQCSKSFIFLALQNSLERSCLILCFKESQKLKNILLPYEARTYKEYGD